MKGAMIMKLKNMEKLRTKVAKMTQQELADELHWSRDRYLNYENGNTQIPADYLIQIADYFKVSTDYILGLSNCTSVENDYINKKLGLSDDAINGLRELTSKDEDMVFANAYMTNKTGKSYRMFSNLNLHVINILLTNHEIFSRWISAFIDYAFSFQFRIPVVQDSKGKWKKIKTRIALASSDNNLDDISVLPENFSYLIESTAKDRMNNAVEELKPEYLQYLLDQGCVDTTTLLINAYNRRFK